MKTKHYLLIGTLVVALTAAIFTGCKKDTTPTTTNTTTTYTDYTAAQDDQTAESNSEDTKNIADAASSGQALDRIMSTCSTVTGRDTTIGSTVDTLREINFGPTNCLCADGRLRRGIIFIWYTPKNYFTAGDSVHMSFKNYYVDSIGITGYRSICNLGKDSSGTCSWIIKAGLTLSYPNGTTATWNATRTHTRVFVGGAWYYTVSGTANGTSRKGLAYSVTVSNTSPLYHTMIRPVNGGCKYIESGTATVSLPLFTISIVYGTTLGTCSSQAVATIGGKSYTFTQK